MEGIQRIAPSILNADMGELPEILRTLEDAGIDTLHLDVMDGVFVPPLTFGAPICRAITRRSELIVEAHLMIQDPGGQVKAFAEAGCRRLVIHPEADIHCHRILQTIRQAGMEAGVALNPGTPACLLPQLIDVLDHVLVMTVNPGWGGQSFLGNQLGKLEEVAKLKSDLGLGYSIQVDGGMNPDTIRRCRSAGAESFVVGTGLFRHPEGLEVAIREHGEAAQ